MNLPIWVTVVISGFVAGFICRIVSGRVFLPVILGGTGPYLLADNWALVALIGGATQAAVTGLVLLVLLPPLSDVRVGFGTTFVAALIGNLIRWSAPWCCCDRRCSRTSTAAAVSGCCRRSGCCRWA